MKKEEAEDKLIKRDQNSGTLVTLDINTIRKEAEEEESKKSQIKYKQSQYLMMQGAFV